MDSSIGHTRNETQGPEEGKQNRPLSSMTLQSAPLLPNGTTWTLDGSPGPGQRFPTRKPNEL